MTGPRVTVVIPTYNRSGLVVEAIGSVLRQSYRDLEIVVSDDGSTDDTAARVAAFGAPVRYLGLAHGGRAGRTRNRGIDAARGELIALLDDDDLWAPDKLARQVALMDREGLDLVFTDRRVEYREGRAPETIVSPAPQSPDRLLDLVLQGHFPSVCTVLAGRSILRQVSGFDETLETGEDLDLWLRLARVARAGRVPEALVVVRRQPGSLSERNAALAFRNAILVLHRSLAAGDLLPTQRRLCRSTLGRLHGRLAEILATRRETAAAMHAALQAVRYAPASRAAWKALARTGRRAVRP